MLTRTITAILLLLLLTASAAADSVRLRPRALLAVGADTVRLADIAKLEGPEATRHADLVIATPADPTATLEVPIATVRERLGAAGVHWGLVNLSGGAVVTVLPAASTAAAPVAMRETSIRLEPTGLDHRAPEGEDEWSARDLLAHATLRGRIARDLVHAIEVDPSDLRLRFDRGDAAVLDADPGDRRFEVVPTSSVHSDRVALAVRAWSSGRIADSWTIEVRPLIRTTVAVLARDLDRNDAVADADFVLDPQWMTPSQARLAIDPDEVTGRLATRRLRAGEVVRAKQVRRRTLIERGDRVVVRCLVGGTAITLKAEAREDGALGDRIELQKLGERVTFTATVAGSGEAIVDLARRTGPARVAAAPQ